MTKKTTMWAMLGMLITAAPAWGQQVPFVSNAGARAIPTITATPAGTPGAAPQKAVEAQKLFEEHFDKFTAGSPEAPDSENLSGGSAGGYRIKQGMMSVEGWTGYHVYQAGGACALRAYESYGSTYYGHLSTPEAALYGEATITLRARRMPGATAGRVIISL